MARILVADDDRSMCEALTMMLSAEGHEVRTVYDGVAAVATYRAGCDGAPWDLVILDIVMPRLDGFDAAAAIRSDDPATPILMLSSKGDIVDKRSGFRAGADDYIVKPFDADELLLRVGALLRRGGLAARDDGTGGAKADRRVFEVGDLVIDFTRYEVSVAGRTAQLTPKEFQMLAFMADAPGKVFTNEELISGVWGDEYVEGSISIPVYIRRIRMKIEEDPSSPRYLKTAWRFGYQLCPQG